LSYRDRIGDAEPVHHPNVVADEPNSGTDHADFGGWLVRRQLPTPI
jgi:hypothetical protein